MELWRRLLFLLRRKRFDRDLDDEMRFHLEMKARKNRESGLGDKEAEYAAQRSFGNALLLREQSRDAWGWRAVETLAQDVRFAVRMMRRSPVLTTAAVLMLALGIGASTTVSSIASALLLRSLPYRQPERLVVLEATHEGGSKRIGPDDFRDWQEQNTVFDKMAYTSPVELNLTGQGFSGSGDAERITGRSVSDGFFALLGVRPLLGRWFVREEITAGRDGVIILSYRLWVRRFNARPDICGRWLALNGRSYTVVGVMPQTFRFNEERIAERVTDFWIPLVNRCGGRGCHMYLAYARLKPGVSLAAAQSQMSAIAKRLEQAYPDDRGWGVRVTGLRDYVMAELGPALLIFSVAVGLVLLIACANVTNLSLARTAARTKEIAIRRALGAGRPSVLRLLLTESMLLAATGTLLGLLLTRWAISLAIAAAPARLELGSILFIDRNVLGFALLLSALAGILTGLAPALRVSRVGFNENLKQGNRSETGARGFPALGALVISEVALAVLLLVVAGLLTKSFMRLLDVDLGFRTKDILTMRLELPRTKYPREAQQARFYQDLLARIRTLPGVLFAGATFATPISDLYSAGPIQIQGRPMPRDWVDAKAVYHFVTPDYFRCLGVPLLKGRSFTDRDQQGAEQVMIVNQALARQFFSGEDPIGKKINGRTVVGIVGDVRQEGPMNPVMAETYSPHAQDPENGMALVVRTAVDPLSLVGPVRAEIRAMDRELAVSDVSTMEQVFSESVSVRRQLTALMAFFSAIALVLAALGLAGVMWYSVSQRTHEIGVRMTFGARQSDILQLVLRRGLSLTLAGLTIGLGVAFAVTRMLASFLYGVSPNDPTAFMLAPILLISVALLASYIPARRAARVDPIQALRCE